MQSREELRIQNSEPRLGIKSFAGSFGSWAEEKNSELSAYLLDSTNMISTSGSLMSLHHPTPFATFFYYYSNIILFSVRREKRLEKGRGLSMSVPQATSTDKK